DRHGPLAPVRVDEDRPHPGVRGVADSTNLVTAGRFHLDDVGSPLGEYLGRVRAHEHGREVEHPDPGQRGRWSLPAHRLPPTPGTAGAVAGASSPTTTFHNAVGCARTV